MGSDLAPNELLPGMRLVAPRNGVQYLIVSVTKHRIVARFRRGAVGRWSRLLHDVVPSEVIGFQIIT